jgi:hypothetical protein
MKFARILGAILIGGGVIVFASSFLVELTIFSDDPGLGIRQITGIVTGSVSVIAGAVLLFGKQREIAFMLSLTGIALLAVGILMSLVSLLIDLVGFRTSPGFGPRQIAGVMSGLLAIAGGLVVFFSRKKLPGV